MDETRSVRRYTRRLSIAAAICCGFPQANANELPTLGRLLNHGWSTGQVPGRDGSQKLKLPAVPSLVRPAPTPIDVPIILTPTEVLKRAAPETADASTSGTRVFDAPVVGPSLARLIQSRTERKEMPIRRNAEGIRLDLAPSVHRVDVERQAALALEEAVTVPKPRVTVATPFLANSAGAAERATAVKKVSQAPDPAALALPVLLSAHDNEQASEGYGGKADRSLVETANESLAMQPCHVVAESTNQASNGTVENIEAAPSMASLLQEFASPVTRNINESSPEPFAAEVVASEMATEVQSTEPKAAEDQTLNTDDPIAKVPALNELPDLPIPSAGVASDQEAIASTPTPSEPQVGSVGTTTAEEKLTQLSMPDREVSLPISRLSRTQSSVNQPTMGSLQATRLRKSAQESLQTAYDRAARGANHSARKYATEALRLAVATRDATEGGNQNTLALDSAFDAIRESEDFCGRYGPANPHALGRMIISHQTTVLKQRNPDELSAYEAADAYLSFARERLITAGGTMPEASHALVLLGRLEKQVSRSSRTYCDAVSVTLHRAAIDIEPANAAAHCALGRTMLEQGLTEQAAQALQRSVELTPTRAAYKGLLEVARRTGDATAARACTAALNHPALGTDVPVVRLDVDAFARTHQPDVVHTHQNQQGSKPSTGQHDTPRVSLRSLFPFTRR